jgi:hypothetical protein
MHGKLRRDSLRSLTHTHHMYVYSNNSKSTEDIHNHELRVHRLKALCASAKCASAFFITHIKYTMKKRGPSSDT